MKSDRWNSRVVVGLWVMVKWWFPKVGFELGWFGIGPKCDVNYQIYPYYHIFPLNY